MAHRSNPEKEGEQKVQSNFTPNLSFLMQHMQSRSRENVENRSFVGASEGNDNRRVFPFQATPSGNLKIIPNQVVFESKKVSVVVADPQHTKVNVKAELGRPGIDVGRSVSESSERTGLIDLPPGVTPSTINQLQSQKKLPNTEYKPRTQPYKPYRQTEMEQRHLEGEASYRAPKIEEVPLSSLGFTNDEPIDWDNVILPEKTDLYEELSRRITNYKNADCIVHIDHDEFHCHLLVLQSYSTFFDEKNSKEIDLTGSSVTSKAFSIIYDWMISPTCESCHLLRRDNILEIFMAAQYLGIKELEEQCWAFIDNDELFSEDTAFLLYLEAKKIGNKAVMELMVPRIMKFFLMLVSTKDFLELSVDELCLLLRSNYICVNSEMEILMSAVRWLMHEWENRKQHMLNVLKCVRFGLIAPWQLVDVKRNPENPEFMELMSYTEVQKMVDDGLAFVIIKYWYGNQTEDYYHWIDLLGLTEPTNRNWVGEDKNYVTYREFLLYLEEYQKTKIPELKARKSRAKPTPPSSPPKDYSSSPTRICANHVQSYNPNDASSGQGAGISNNLPKHSKHASKMTSSSYSPPDIQAGMSMPAEMLNEYFSNPDKSNAKGGHSNPTISNEERMNERIAFDNKLGEGEEFLRRFNGLRNARFSYKYFQQEKNSTNPNKSNYNGQQERNAVHTHYLQQCEPNLIFSTKNPQKKCRKASRHSEERTNSPKSEEEAATAIQAVYRGYKARRRFYEIKKSSSEEKQKARKIAELLAVSNEQTFRSLSKPVKACNSSVSQDKNETERKQRTPSPRRKIRNALLAKNSDQKNNEGNANSVKNLGGLRFNVYTHQLTSTQQKHLSTDSAIPKNSSNSTHVTKSIKTIKSPAFFFNCDEKTNSPTASDNTDTEDLLSSKNNVKLISATLVNGEKSESKAVKSTNASYESGNNNTEESKMKFKEIQARSTNCKRPLPQRISDSMLGLNACNYFLHNSLFFPDRESVLIFGGIDPHEEYGQTENTGKDIYRFKPDENSWELVGETPAPRHHHSVAYLKGRVYLVGGADPREDEFHRKSMVVGTVWSYDPTIKAWFNEPGLLTPRKNFGLVVIHGKMYAMGGQDKNGIALRTVEMYDPSKSAWTEMQPMCVARVGPASVKYRDLIWVAGGMTKSKKELFSMDIECYDPIKNLWLKAEPLRSPRCFATLYVISDCLYMIGGASTTSNSTESIDSVDVWDANLHTWEELTKMSIARHGHCIGSIGDQLLIIGGVTTVFMKTLNSVECYCCERGKWMKGVSSLPRAISGHGVVSLPPANLLMDS